MKAILGIVLAALLMAGDADAGLPKSRAGGEKVFRHTEKASRAWLGVSVRDVTSEQAKEFGLKKAEGAFVGDVVSKSPADSAGIKEGDFIVEFNGRQIYDADGLVSAVRKAQAGTKTKAVVVRKGDRKELSVTLGKAPKRWGAFAVTPPELRHRVRFFKGSGRIGLSLIPLNPQLGSYFEAPDDQGLLVEKVDEGSAAEKAGFKAGDVILKVGDKRVSKVHELRSELDEYKEGDKVNIEILRKGSRKTLTVEIEENEEFDFSFDDFSSTEIPEEIEIPDVEQFEYRFEELQPELDRLQQEVERLRKRLDDGLRHRLIREPKDRNVMWET